MDTEEMVGCVAVFLVICFWAVIIMTAVQFIIKFW